MGIKLHNVWLEGFSVTGQSAGARYLGEWPGDTFKEACKAWVAQCEEPEFYNEKQNTYYACDFFSDGNEAVKSFG